MFKYFLIVLCCWDLSVFVRNVGGDRRIKIVLSYVIGLVFVFGFIFVGISFKLGWMDSMIFYF